MTEGGPSDDAPAAAAGAMTDALETVERARGHLYSFHQLIGRADLKLDEAVEGLRAAGAGDLADGIQRDLIGRNVLEDRWTFQVVEEFDDGYWSAFRDHEREVRTAVAGGRRHSQEAAMKAERRSPRLD